MFITRSATITPAITAGVKWVAVMAAGATAAEAGMGAGAGAENETFKDARVSTPQGQPGTASQAADRPIALRSRLAWQERLAHIVDTMRQMSLFSDPQEMVSFYGDRMERYYRYDGFISLSRRDLSAPYYRITRSSRWTEEIDPWRHRDRLPILSGGLLGELIYSDQPRLMTDLRVDPADPAFEYLEGMGSLVAIPHFDRGQALNMVVTLLRNPRGIDPEEFPEAVWMSNLFGRATNTLVLTRQLGEAYTALDRELKVVAEIQRSLLPSTLPDVPGLDFAAHYQTSKRAGGDYYDFFQLPGGRIGFLVADVSGHGTPAAVLMAILHAIAHLQPVGDAAPHEMLAFINRTLSRKYTVDSGMFVTAFYAIYDPATRRLQFCSAGHNPPRIRVGFTGPCGPVLSLDQAQGLPLGVLEGATYHSAEVVIDPGDALVLYTDGFTEAFGPTGDMYGVERLDKVISCKHVSAAALLDAVLEDVREFTGTVPAGDDRTMIVVTAK